MPLFRYRAYGPQGELAEGEIEAGSESAVDEALRARRLVAFEVISAESDPLPWWRRELNSGRRGIAALQLAGMTREFATLSTAGVPLVEALRIMVDEMSEGRARPVLEKLLTEVLGGVALSHAMEKQKDSFSPEYVSVIRAGEASGGLSRSLDELASLLERRVELRSRVHSALVYPAILIVLSIVSLVVITGVLVPNIAPIFNESNRPVPATISFLMTLHDHWLEICFGFAAIGGALGAAVALALQNPSTRRALDAKALKLPLLGAFLLRQETARFTRTLGTLLTSGVPLLQATLSAAATVKNSALAASLGQAHDRVRQGESLHGALRDCTPLPALALRMISIGEQAADLGDMLLRVAAMFEKQTERSLERFMTVLTPSITLLVAVMVGLLIVTIMNAVLSLNDIAIG
jgi:general secretion pathway protein F